MANEPKAGEKKKKTKQVSWKISERLRKLLNSHAEYLAAISGKESDVHGMVEQWLEDRLRQEERLRARRILGIEEKEP